jgi:hypothetical protein
MAFLHSNSSCCCCFDPQAANWYGDHISWEAEVFSLHSLLFPELIQIFRQQIFILATITFSESERPKGAERRPRGLFKAT